MEKKSFAERYRAWRDKVHEWADGHSVLGFPVRHPTLFLLVVFIVVVAICGTCNSIARKKAVDVPASSHVQERARRANETSAMTLDHYAYYCTGFEAVQGKVEFDYNAQCFSTTNVWSGGSYDYVAEFRVPAYHIQRNGIDYPSFFLNANAVVSNWDRVEFAWDDGDGYTYQVFSASRTVKAYPVSQTLVHSSDYLMVRIYDDDPTTVLYLDIVGIVVETTYYPQNVNVIDATWYQSYQPFRLGSNASVDNVYTQGFDAGYDTGYGDGYSIGKEYGYQLGNSSDMTLTTLFWNVIDQPFAVVYRLLNFDVLGVNIFAFVMGLVTLGLVGFVIKLVI